MQSIVYALKNQFGFSLSMHGQPIVSIHDSLDNPPYWYELLLRLNHPTHGMQMPIDFMPSDSHPHLLAAMDWWVLEFANERLRQYPELSFSLNFTRHLLADPLLTRKLRTLFQGIERDRITFEVSERYIWSAREHEQLTDMRAIVKLSLDDVGENRLNELVYLPISGFKIDGALTQRICSDTRASAIVQALISLAWNLDWIVVCEFVDSQATLIWLRMIADRFMGVRLYAQGHAVGGYKRHW